MEKVRCSNCNYEAEKPTLEILIYTVIKDGGNVFDNKCPKCSNTTLKLNEVEK